MYERKKKIIDIRYILCILENNEYRILICIDKK